MAKTFGVSIITVRNAVSALVDKGLVEKKQGKGTFVSKAKVYKGHQETSELYRDVRAYGDEVRRTYA